MVAAVKVFWCSEKWQSKIQFLDNAKFTSTKAIRRNSSRLDEVAPKVWKIRNCFGRLSLISDREPVRVFLYSLEDAADDILTTLGVDENTTKLKDIISAFNNHFDARKNVIVERAKFSTRVQNQGETDHSYRICTNWQTNVNSGHTNNNTVSNQRRVD